jgi:hypothetical protein
VRSDNGKGENLLKRQIKKPRIDRRIKKKKKAKKRKKGARESVRRIEGTYVSHYK